MLTFYVYMFGFYTFLTVSHHIPTLLHTFHVLIKKTAHSSKVRLFPATCMPLLLSQQAHAHPECLFLQQALFDFILLDTITLSSDILGYLKYMSPMTTSFSTLYFNY